MCRIRERLLPAILSAASVVSSTLVPASAASQYTHVQVAHQTVHHPAAVRTVYVYVPEKKKNVTLHEYMQAHPKVRAATIGAGVGTAAGALTGLITGRGIMRGALIGAGTGAGVGLIRTSQIMQRHPIMRDVATGSAVGLGLGWATSNRYQRFTAPGTAVGALAGLGVGVYKAGGL
jgi:hypothetical protein